jgi:hypothetical protein
VIIIVSLLTSTAKADICEPQKGTEEKDSWNIESEENVIIIGKNLTCDNLTVNGTLTLVNVSLSVEKSITVSGELYIYNSTISFLDKYTNFDVYGKTILRNSTIVMSTRGYLNVWSGNIAVRDSIINKVDITVINSSAEFNNNIIVGGEVFFRESSPLFEGNWVKSQASYFYLLELSDCYNVTVTNNVIQTESRYSLGLKVDKSSEILIANNIIKCNFIKIDSSDVIFDTNYVSTYFGDDILSFQFTNSSSMITNSDISSLYLSVISKDSEIILINNTIDTKESSIISVEGRSSVTGINTNVDRIDIHNKIVENITTNTTFISKSYLKIGVLTPSGMPVQNTLLVIHDKYGTEIYNGHTDSNGETSWILYTEYILWSHNLNNDSKEKNVFTPNTIWVYINGQCYTRLQEDGGEFTIILPQNEPPPYIPNMLISLLIICVVIICAVIIGNKIIKRKKIYALSTGIGIMFILIGSVLMNVFESKILDNNITVYAHPYSLYGICFVVLGTACVLLTFGIPLIKHFKKETH